MKCTVVVDIQNMCSIEELAGNYVSGGRLPLAARSEVWVCYLEGSSPAGGMAVCLLWMLCAVELDVPAKGC